MTYYNLFKRAVAEKQKEIKPVAEKPKIPTVMPSTPPQSTLYLKPRSKDRLPGIVPFESFLPETGAELSPEVQQIAQPEEDLDETTRLMEPEAETSLDEEGLDIEKPEAAELGEEQPLKERGREGPGGSTQPGLDRAIENMDVNRIPGIEKFLNFWEEKGKNMSFSTFYHGFMKQLEIVNEDTFKENALRSELQKEYSIFNNPKMIEKKLGPEVIKKLTAMWPSKKDKYPAFEDLLKDFYLKVRGFTSEQEFVNFYSTKLKEIEKQKGEHSKLIPVLPKQTQLLLTRAYNNLLKRISPITLADFYNEKITMPDPSDPKKKVPVPGANFSDLPETEQKVIDFLVKEGKGSKINLVDFKDNYEGYMEQVGPYLGLVPPIVSEIRERLDPSSKQYREFEAALVDGAFSPNQKIIMKKIIESAIDSKIISDEQAQELLSFLQKGVIPKTPLYNLKRLVNRPISGSAREILDKAANEIYMNQEDIEEVDINPADFLKSLATVAAEFMATNEWKKVPGSQEAATESLEHAMELANKNLGRSQSPSGASFLKKTRYDRTKLKSEVPLFDYSSVYSSDKEGWDAYWDKAAAELSSSEGSFLKGIDSLKSAINQWLDAASKKTTNVSEREQWEGLKKTIFEKIEDLYRPEDILNVVTNSIPNKVPNKEKLINFIKSNSPKIEDAMNGELVKLLSGAGLFREKLEDTQTKIDSSKFLEQMSQRYPMMKQLLIDVKNPEIKNDSINNFVARLKTIVKQDTMNEAREANVERSTGIPYQKWIELWGNVTQQLYDLTGISEPGQLYNALKNHSDLLIDAKLQKENPEERAKVQALAARAAKATVLENFIAPLMEFTKAKDGYEIKEGFEDWLKKFYLFKMREADRIDQILLPLYHKRLSLEGTPVLSTAPKKGFTLVNEYKRLVTAVVRSATHLGLQSFFARHKDIEPQDLNFVLDEYKSLQNIK